MKMRLFVFLALVALLAFYTGAQLANLFPAHPFAAMGASILFVGFFVGFQFAYRREVLPEESQPMRTLAWSAAGAMGLWATFFLLSIVASVAGWILPGRGTGAALAHALPVATAGAAVCITALGFGQAVAGPLVKTVAVLVRGLPPEFRELRIAQISDLHIGPTIRSAQVERMVQRVLALKPDLIAVTGDLADGDVRRLAPHIKPLGRLQASLGVYFVTGNHEYYWSAADWIAKVKEFGFRLLINENQIVSHGSAKVLIAGVPDDSGGDFVQGHRPDVSRAAATDQDVDLRILLSHRPGNAPAAERAGFDLQLSGHTHGGQFFPASLFIPLFHRYSRGLYQRGKMWIYVNPGTGYWGPPHRFAVPSEITLLTLRGIPKEL